MRQCACHSICIILSCEIALRSFGRVKVLTFILLPNLKLSLFQHSVSLVALFEICHCSHFSIVSSCNCRVNYLLNIWANGFLVSLSLIFETHIAFLIQTSVLLNHATLLSSLDSRILAPITGSRITMRRLDAIELVLR